MRLFKKTTYLIIRIGVFCVGSLLLANSIQAAGGGIPLPPPPSANINVVFTPDPMFQEANFLPGSNVSGLAQVSNNSGVNKPIAVEAINITNDVIDSSTGELFGDALNLIIKENSAGIYSGTLTEFFNKGEFVLSNLTNGASTTYEFSIAFTGAAGNGHQGKNLGFDILIGFQGEEGGGGSGGSGGGGGGGIRGLSIFSEASTNITDTTATIEWATSYFSTSQVVYCRQDQNCVFDFSAPSLYGYLSTTAEYDTPANPNGVTHHSVAITGLIPNTTYNYRVISHASPPTISREHFFTTLISSNTNDIENIEKSVEEVKVLGEETTPILEIKKSFGSEFINPGDIVKYEIEVTNTGNFDALDVVISENLPYGLVFESNNQREQSFTLGNIKPNETKKISYMVVASNDIVPGIYISATQLSATNHDSVEAKADLEIRKAEISVTGDAVEVLDVPLVKGESIEEENTDEISEEGDEDVEKNNEENITEDEPQEITKSNIKEWLFWLLLLILAIELYILIGKKKKKDDADKDKDENYEEDMN